MRLCNPAEMIHGADLTRITRAEVSPSLVTNKPVMHLITTRSNIESQIRVQESIPHNWSNNNAVLRSEHTFRVLSFSVFFRFLRQPIEKVHNGIIVIRIQFCTIRVGLPTEPYWEQTDYPSTILF